jgi:hypothetical protein
MQNIFLSNQKPEEYVEKNGAGKYPAAPKKCPHSDCGIPLKMKKNGFYTRALITLTFAGRIRIRRYKCPKCGGTVSMLPSFCVAGFTYGVEFIITLLQHVINTGSIKKTVKKWRIRFESISRRLVSKYMTRLRNNRKMIQYGINQLSPDNIGLGRMPGDNDWTKSFLFGIRPSLCPEFNADFQKITGKSFMSLQNSIA